MVRCSMRMGVTALTAFLLVNSIVPAHTNCNYHGETWTCAYGSCCDSYVGCCDDRSSSEPSTAGTIAGAAVFVGIVITCITVCVCICVACYQSGAAQSQSRAVPNRIVLAPVLVPNQAPTRIAVDANQYQPMTVTPQQPQPNTPPAAPSMDQPPAYTPAPADLK